MDFIAAAGKLSAEEDDPIELPHHLFISIAAGGGGNNFSFNNNNNWSAFNDSTISSLHPLWYQHNVYISVIISIAYGLVFIAGLVGNLLVIFAVLFRGGRGGRGRSMNKRVSNIFLANLAVADLLVICACLPFTLISNLLYRKFK